MTRWHQKAQEFNIHSASGSGYEENAKSLSGVINERLKRRALSEDHPVICNDALDDLLNLRKDNPRYFNGWDGFRAENNRVGNGITIAIPPQNGENKSGA